MLSEIRKLQSQMVALKQAITQDYTTMRDFLIYQLNI